MSLGMPSVRLLVLLLALVVGCLLPSSAAAQAWLDAYNARDYEKAANLLHEIVADREFAFSGRDPRPLRHLAVLYAKGLGVSADSIAACALALDAEMAGQMSPPAKPLLTREDADQYQADLDDAKEFAAGRCGALSSADFDAAMFSRAGCYAFGMPEQVLTIGGRSVRIGRAGIAFGDKRERDITNFMCAVAIARARSVSIEPPENAATGVAARHFIELVFWRAGGAPRRFVANWHIYEVAPNGIGIGAQEVLQEVAGWPGTAIPSQLDARLTMEMIRSGHVRWRIDGAPPRRGWLMLPEQGASQ